jgi:hypothetical protein
VVFKTIYDFLIDSTITMWIVFGLLRALIRIKRPLNTTLLIYLLLFLLTIILVGWIEHIGHNVHWKWWKLSEEIFDGALLYTMLTVIVPKSRKLK